VLADALIEWYDHGRLDLLDSYSADCLRRVWRAEHFSWWMTSMLHNAPHADEFDEKLQLSQLRYVTTSRPAATSLAETTSGSTACERGINDRDRDGDESGARTKPPFRADHVGSLLRPPALLRARDDFAAGRIDAAEPARRRGRRHPRGRAQAGGVGLQSPPRRVPPCVVAHGLHLPARRHHEGGGHIAVKSTTRGDIEFTPAAIHVNGKLGVSRAIFATRSRS